MAKKKPYRVIVSVTSISTVDGVEVENQVHSVEEGASNENELTLKCFVINKAVLDATNQAMKTLAAAGGYVTDVPQPEVSPKPRKR